MKFRLSFIILSSVLALLVVIGLINHLSAAPVNVAAMPITRGQQREAPVNRSFTNLVNSLPYTMAVEVAFSDPASLDPSLIYDSVSLHVLRQIYEPLVTYNREKADELIPLLATDWTISADAHAYTFTIRSEVNFHNGAPLTAEDVAFSFWRGLLVGDCNTPQWLANEALFDLSDVTQLVAPDGSLICDPVGLKIQPPATLEAACQTVKDAITFDNTAGTVTFNLVHAWNPFLDTIAQWGNVLNKEWLIANGGWGGSCSTWQNYYGTSAANSPIVTLANGTGPFMLDYWTTDTEVALERNPDYWLQSPLWTDGPKGSAALESVLIKTVPDSAARYQMLIDGDADLGNFIGYEDQLANYVLLHYDQPNGQISTLVHSTGTLRAYAGVLDVSATDAFFTYDIVDDSVRNYIGSGALDGDGIPPDFFADIHVRKAFNYAFNWSQYSIDMFGGQGIQRTGPIIKSLMGYSDTQSTYFYSPTLALQELNQAWGGQILSTGFVMTISYNTDNVTRQMAAENIKAGIEGLSPNFHVNIIDLPWPEFLSDMRASRIPIFVSGWVQDIPHPHNWVEPYLFGTYADRQRLPSNLQDLFQAKANSCLLLAGEAARPCYEDIQATTYLNAIDIFLLQGTRTQFVRAEVQGYYMNPAHNNQPYFYAFSKGPLPIVEEILPSTEQMIPFSAAYGATATINLPTGSVSSPTKIVVIPGVTNRDPPTGFELGELAFEIEAYDSSGTPISNMTFNNPVTITLHYNEQTIGLLNEEELRLFWWNGNDWEDAACGPYVRDISQNTLQVPICHLSEFVLGGITYYVYLPIVYCTRL